MNTYNLLIMKNIIILILVFFHSTLLKAQTDTLGVKLEKMIIKFQKENEILEEIMRGYDAQIDSLVKSVSNKENETNILLISYYMKMNENSRDKMKLKVYLIDSLNTLILKEKE